MILTRLSFYAFSLLFAVIILTSGCEIVPQRQLPDPPSPEELESHFQQAVNLLLDEAYLAYSDNRLTTPIDDNAYYRYLQVLALDPANTSASQGIAEIAEKYLEWAINAVEQRQYRRAVNYINKARSVDETHPNIAAVERKVAASQGSRTSTYLLSTEALDNRGSSIISELHHIATHIATHITTHIATRTELQHAKVVITARDDREGRWIYQQLNDATANRIRATFQLGQIPKVHLVYR